MKWIAIIPSLLYGGNHLPIGTRIGDTRNSKYDVAER